MKVYQIHQYGGEWDDSYDEILETHLNKDKAYSRLKEITKQYRILESKSKKCNRCPCMNISHRKVDESDIQRTKEYCDQFDSVSSDGFIICNNHTLNKYSDSKFEIIEVNVID